MPDIKGSTGASFLGGSSTYASGAFTVGNGDARAVGTGSNLTYKYFNFNASNYNSIYGNSNTVQPPAVKLLPCIKAYSDVDNLGSLDVAQLENYVQNNVVHKTGDENVAGVKTFTSEKIISEGSYSSKPVVLTRFSDFALFDSTQNSNHYSGFYVLDKNNAALGYVEYVMYGSGSGVLRLRARQNSAGDIHSSVLVAIESESKSFKPDGNGGTTLGTSSNRWGQIYSTSTTISTSDSRQKTSPEPLPDAVLDAWADVGFVQFQMLDSVAAKGEADARLHSGLIAQQIDAAFKARGLDASRYGLFCWDEWDANPEQGIEEPGDQYSLRYEEALCMEAAYQRRRADRAEARIANLEEEVSSLKSQLTQLINSMK